MSQREMLFEKQNSSTLHTKWIWKSELELQLEYYVR
jgi:hypothetical protein